MATLFVLKASLKLATEKDYENERHYYTSTKEDRQDRLRVWRTIYEHGLVSIIEYEADETGQFRYKENNVQSW